MSEPLSFFWFQPARKLVVRSAAGEYAGLFSLAPESLLGEMLPRKDGAGYLVAGLPPAFVEQAVELRGEGASATRVCRLTPGATLGVHRPLWKSELTWRPGDWSEVVVQGFTWSEGLPTPVSEQRFDARQGAFPIGREWTSQPTSLVLTPVDADGRQGASESVTRAGDQLAKQLSARLPEQAARVAAWPGPIAAALVAALSQVRTHKGADLFPQRVCQAFRRPDTFGDFLDVYESHPALVHLFAASPRLLLLTAAHGVPDRPAHRSAAHLVAIAAGNGRADAGLLVHLQRAPYAETAFWAKQLLEAKDIKSLYNLRVRRGCAAGPDEAALLDKQLTQLEREGFDAVRAELLPAASSPLHVAVQDAEDKRREAVERPTPQSIAEAVGGYGRVREQMLDHLEGLLKFRPASPWGQLRAACEQLREGRPLSQAARLLRDLRGSAQPDAVPPATPSCWLHVDAVWQQAWLEEQGRRHQGLMAIAGWCRGLLDGRPTPLGGHAADGDPADLPLLWQGWLDGWQAVDLDGVHKRLRPDGLAQTAQTLKRQADDALASLQAAGDEADPVRRVLEAMGERQALLRLTFWVEADRLRRATEEVSARRGRAVRSAEGRAEAEQLLGQVRAAVVRPVSEWAGLANLLLEQERLEDQERASEEAWAWLLGRLPEGFREQLRLPGHVSPLDNGLDATVERVREHLPALAEVVSREADEAEAQLRRAVEQAGVLGLAPEGVAVEPDGDGEPSSRLYAAPFWELRQAARQAERATADRLALSRLRPRLEEELTRRVAAAMSPRTGPEVEPPAPDRAAGDRRVIEDAVPRLLLSADAAGLANLLTRLAPLADLLALRRDVLGLGLTPPGPDLLGRPAAHAWTRAAEQRELVRLLQTLLARSAEPLELLLSPPAFDGYREELARVVAAGGARRWWARLYREMADVLCGKFARLPRALPPWQTPLPTSPAGLQAALDWLRRREGMPLPLKDALVEGELLTAEEGAS